MGSGRSTVAAIALVALVVAGCSGNGDTHATPTTAPHAVLNLGPCPKTDSLADPTKVNAGVKGLDRALVPITAVRVRMCRYEGNFKLVGERTMVRAANVARFEAEANQFPDTPPTTQPPPRPGPQGLVGFDCPQSWYHVVTFASASQQVELRESCGWVSNGILAGSGMHWFAELQNYTTGSTAMGSVIGAILEVGGPTGIRRPIPGKVFARNTSGKTWQATTTATQPLGLDLPAGTYRFTGTSPLINSGRSTCGAQRPVVVVAYRTTEVQVVCNIR